MKRTILLSAVAITIVSCTEKVELELGELTEPRLVVDGWITDQVKPHRVRLTTSRSYFENQQAPVVSGAHVTIDDGEQTVVLLEQPPGSGDYFTPPDHAGQVGRLYRLRIEHDGDSWEATDLMRPVPPIDSIAFEPATNGFGNNIEEGYSVRIWTHELPGLGDHYRWKSWVNGESRSDSLKAASFTDDVPYDGAHLNGVVVDWIRAVPGDTVRVEQHAISKQAYDVILAILMNTEWRGGIFDPPPANVPSNISNGGFGFFGAASVKDRTAIVP